MTIDRIQVCTPEAVERLHTIIVQFRHAIWEAASEAAKERGGTVITTADIEQARKILGFSRTTSSDSPS